MAEDIAATPRRIDRTHGVTTLGPDAQVDDKALVIPPGDFRLADPFLLMSEDWFSSPGFDWHPHRGLETVTIVLDGALEHGDNLGSAGVLAPGDVQWMTAGRGIIHRELAFRNEHAHTLQLWVNLPGASKMTQTRYQDLPAAGQGVLTVPGATASVISGRSGAITGPARNHWPITGLLLSIEPGSSFTQRLPGHDRAFLYVLAGQVSAAGRMLRAGQVAWSDPVRRPRSGATADDSQLTLRAPDADEPAKVMLFSGRPIGEPVAVGGPFVMNSKAEIARAFRDFQAGKFGQVPRQARLKTR
ncbi:MAG TPA: pirin family protein [Streptosporangiaceae bacterium]|nr:pirin family protein [Streptosporangiaceae bacterium]